MKVQIVRISRESHLVSLANIFSSWSHICAVTLSRAQLSSMYSHVSSNLISYEAPQDAPEAHCTHTPLYLYLQFMQHVKVAATSVAHAILTPYKSQNHFTNWNVFSYATKTRRANVDSVSVCTGVCVCGCMCVYKRLSSDSTKLQKTWGNGRNVVPKTKELFNSKFSLSKL